MRRHKMGRRASESYFTRNAMRVHPRNLGTGPRRGGIRL